MPVPFTEFALLLLISALAGAAFVRLRQPVLIAYIVVGIAAGPAILGSCRPPKTRLPCSPS